MKCERCADWRLWCSAAGAAGLLTRADVVSGPASQWRAREAMPLGVTAGEAVNGELELVLQSPEEREGA